MNKQFTLFLATLGLSTIFSFSSLLNAQDLSWKEVSRGDLNFQHDEILAHVDEGTYFTINFNDYSDFLLNAEEGDVVQIPVGGGKTESFTLEPNTTMHPDLDARYPNIRAFNIISTVNRSIWGKLDVSPLGLRVLIMHPGQPMKFIDPFLIENREAYVLYSIQDYVSQVSGSCGVGPEEEIRTDLHTHGSRDFEFNNCELRTYELAGAATGEFTQAVGGTVELGLAGVVSVVNRMNAVYEVDFGITSSLVPDNDELIYLDPETDPYTNSSPPAMLNENQQNVDNVIGSSNYDIGHVFGLGGGGGVVGIAQFNTPCSSDKARCSSRLFSINFASPDNIGLVCHEMGHQLGGSHSYNNLCGGNRSDNNAVEPGSGTTILSYAAVCTPGPESTWDLNFHGWTMGQMGPSIDQDGCATPTPLDNSAPEIAPLPNSIAVPISTPFVLSADVTDADGDMLTYSWEQIDNEITEDIPPQSSWTEGPVFRAFPPSDSPDRYFPALPNAQSTTWEALPAVSREMNFRITVRDNAPGGGCTKADNITVDVSSLVGPFVLEYPSDPGIIWQSFTEETIIWDAAGTNGFPTFASTVDIFLSTNSGLDYDILLADDVPNSGSLTIEVPPIPTVTARIMVMNSDGEFFDVSNSNFQIEGISEGFQLLPSADEAALCQGETFSYDVSVGAAFGFDDEISLEATNVPEGLSVEIGSNLISILDQTSVSIFGTENLAPGVYEITLTGTSGEFQDEQSITLFINESEPQAISLLAPAPEESLPLVSQFSWEPSLSPIATYRLEIALDPDFDNLFLDLSGLTETSEVVSDLPPESTLHWRVTVQTDCGEAVSESQIFTTQSCLLGSPDVLPVNIPPISTTIESEVIVPLSGTLIGIRVTNLNGIHSRMRDLTASLTSPSGIEVMLFDSICGSEDDFDFSFADDGLEEIDCPPTTGLIYAPEEPLNVFLGEDPQGTWTLTIVDENNGSGGSLLGWQLELCFDEGLTATAGTAPTGVDIYPNPSSGNVQISMDHPERYDLIRIHDVSGKVLKEFNLLNDVPLLNVDISALSSGVYFVSFVGMNGTQSMKLVKTE
jgi:subtilisin-like proprotein convertase family protein